MKNPDAKWRPFLVRVVDRRGNDTQYDFKALSPYWADLYALLPTDEDVEQHDSYHSVCGRELVRLEEADE